MHIDLLKQLLEEAFNAGYQHCNAESSRYLKDRASFEEWFADNKERIIKTIIES